MIKKLANKEKINLFFYAVTTDDSDIGYASALNMNGLFRVNLKTGECEFLRLFPEAELDAQYLHFSAQYVNDKLFFFPQRGGKIVVYNLVEDAFTLIGLEDTTYKYYLRSYKMAQSFQYNNMVYVIGSTYPAILEINPDTLEIKYYSIPCGDDKVMFRGGGKLVGNNFYIPSVFSGVILEFDLLTKNMNIIKIENFTGAWSLEVCDDKLWLAPSYSSESIISYNLITNEIQRLNDFPKDFIPGKIVFIKCFCKGEYIYMHPEQANMCLKVNTKTNQIKECAELKHIFESEMVVYWFCNDKIAYCCKKKLGQELFETGMEDNYILDLDTLQTKNLCFSFSFGKDKYWHECIKYMKESGVFYKRENKEVSLEVFINAVNQMDYEDCVMDKTHVGETIILTINGEV